MEQALSPSFFSNQFIFRLLYTFPPWALGHAIVSPEMPFPYAHLHQGTIQLKLDATIQVLGILRWVNSVSLSTSYILHGN